MPDHVITFTLGQLVGWIAAACGFITAVAAAWAVVWKLIQAARRPNAEQDRKISDLMKEVNALKADLSSLKTDIYQKGADIDQIRSDNRITQEALLALLSHGINGNSIEAMERARDKLTGRLIDK